MAASLPLAAFVADVVIVPLYQSACRNSNQFARSRTSVRFACSTWAVRDARVGAGVGGREFVVLFGAVPITTDGKLYLKKLVADEVPRRLRTWWTLPSPGLKKDGRLPQSRDSRPSRAP
jgi:hypothetical protein